MQHMSHQSIQNRHLGTNRLESQKVEDNRSSMNSLRSLLFRYSEDSPTRDKLRYTNSFCYRSSAQQLTTVRGGRRVSAVCEH
jgi:hypothetical protein